MKLGEFLEKARQEAERKRGKVLMAIATGSKKGKIWKLRISLHGKICWFSANHTGKLLDGRTPWIDITAEWINMIDFLRAVEHERELAELYVDCINATKKAIKEEVKEIYIVIERQIREDKEDD